VPYRMSSKRGWRWWLTSKSKTNTQSNGADASLREISGPDTRSIIIKTWRAILRSDAAQTIALPTLNLLRADGERDIVV
jgi:hypothetical protein